MPTPRLTDDLAQAAADAFRAHGTKTAAAAALGLNPKTFDSRLKVAGERKMCGTEPLVPGFRISQTTAVYRDGQLAAEFIQQKPERGEKFELPAGQKIKAVSALVNEDGREIVKWIKTAEDSKPILLDGIRAAFEAYRPAALIKAPPFTNADLLTVYPIVDLHLGMFSWAKETGADYDLKIAADLLRSSMNNLVARSANSKTALVLDMGDYFHADNSRNQTARSGNPLDVDSRYAKVVQIGFELVIQCVELALQKHDFVEYRKTPGNHDDETSLMLAVAVAAHFRNNDRVKVNTSPSRFYMKQHGKCMVVATHGDMLKMGDLAGFAAAQYPVEWGATVHRYGYTGHIHNEKELSRNSLRGLRAESFNTLAAKDAWHAGEGYQSPRNMVSITLHKDRGEVDRFTVPA
ncbi:oxidoreductase [Mesorhizobium sp. INR15]|uniref:oxidoreductase n=1 Tax=Mesorhizobium sp. INR15 TaxID=2654248 RepID=UPI0018967078|nr:oxidoreductase [Mesorhizobium sp. INR15]QPC91467.1 oxidoreductase [Mesorhizobium sp. INR15]